MRAGRFKCEINILLRGALNLPQSSLWFWRRDILSFWWNHRARLSGYVVVRWKNNPRTSEQIVTRFFYCRVIVCVCERKIKETTTNLFFLQIPKVFICFLIFTNPSARAGYDTRSISKRSLTGLNSEFSFSSTSCLTKAEETNLPNYLPIAGGRIIGFIPFPMVLVLCEMQSVSSRIWTRVAVSNSYDDNHYTIFLSLRRWRDLS